MNTGYVHCIKPLHINLHGRRHNMVSFKKKTQLKVTYIIISMRYPFFP
jgi:hypothetical protein